MWFPDLRPLIYLAAFGGICALLLAVVGVPYGLWWAFHHVSIH